MPWIINSDQLRCVSLHIRGWMKPCGFVLEVTWPGSWTGSDWLNVLFSAEIKVCFYLWGSNPGNADVSLFAECRLLHSWNLIWFWKWNKRFWAKINTHDPLLLCSRLYFESGPARSSVLLLDEPRDICKAWETVLKRDGFVSSGLSQRGPCSVPSDVPVVSQGLMDPPCSC